MEKSYNSNAPKCRVCQERHFIKHCAKFQRMDAKKRRVEAQQRGFCFNCLCTSHKRDFCPSRSKCMVCNKTHHTMLHIDQNGKNTSNSVKIRRSKSPSSSPQPEIQQRRSRAVKRQTTPEPTPRPRSSTSTASQLPAKRPRTSVSDRLSVRSKTHIFLPTVLARVLTSEGRDKVRLIVNTGAAQTVVLATLVECLQLKTTRRGNKHYCTLNLQSFYDQSAKIQITGEIRSQLNTTFPESTEDKKLQSTYEHLTDLADPHFFKPINIEVMLANDQIPRILRAGLIQTSSNMPIAQSSIFGWIISGGCSY
ncbi:uncharacterized protein [Musca autumnalis]|uniref:uncharacterized protein n=1 Tax=Musca autumnalis TaxID=221902 RepID=UPI003CE9C4F9